MTGRDMAPFYVFSFKVLLPSKKAELSLALSLLEIRELQSLAKQRLTARRRKIEKESNRQKKIQENKNK